MDSLLESDAPPSPQEHPGLGRTVGCLRHLVGQPTKNEQSSGLCVKSNSKIDAKYCSGEGARRLNLAQNPIKHITERALTCQ